jgi:Flp pilus assembly protein CpaB
MTHKPTPVAETTPTWAAGLRRRIPFYIIGAIVLAIIAGVLSFIYLDQIRRETLPTQSAVVAVIELKPGIEIGEGMVEFRSVPEGVVPANALGQVGAALGRIPARPIMTNEILQTSDFIGEAGAGLSARLPDGRWAVVLPAGWLASPLPSMQSGDHLDLMAYLPGQPIEESGVIVNAVEILETRGEATSPEQLVLAVSLDDATAVLYARANGFSLLALLRPEGQ